MNCLSLRRLVFGIRTPSVEPVHSFAGAVAPDAYRIISHRAPESPLILPNQGLGNAKESERSGIPRTRPPENTQRPRLFLFFSFANFRAFLMPPISANITVIFSVSICLEFSPSYRASFFSFR